MKWWNRMVDKLFARGGKPGEPGEVVYGKHGSVARGGNGGDYPGADGEDEPAEGDGAPGKGGKIDVAFIGDEVRSAREQRKK